MEEKPVRFYDEQSPTGPSSFIVEADARLLIGIVLWGAAVGALLMGRFKI